MDTLLSNQSLPTENPIDHQIYNIQLFIYPRSFIVCASHNGLLERVGSLVQQPESYREYVTKSPTTK